MVDGQRPRRRLGKVQGVDGEMALKRRQGRPPVIDNAYDRILDEAAALFGQRGYESSSLSDVAKSIGVSKAAIFHYFPTKQDIYDAIIVRTLKGLTETVSVAVQEETTGLARLRRFMIEHAAYFEENFWAFVTMLVGYGGMTDSLLKEEALALRDRYEGLLRQIIAGGIEAGELKNVDIAATGRGILSLLNWMARWFKPGTDTTAADIAETYFNLFVRGLQRGPADIEPERPNVPGP